jgi:acyl-ACP thioesterase
VDNPAMAPAPDPMDLVPPVSGGRVFEAARRAGLADAGPTGRVRLDALARWLQDVAYEDVEDAGLVEQAMWVVRRLRLRVQRFPRFGDRVTVRTWCSGLGRMWAERRTALEGVEAVAVWVHLDPRSLRPAPFSPQEHAVYDASAAGREIKARLRHPLPPADAPRRPWWFRAADLDLAAHVNNAAYWAVVEELIGAGPEPDGFDAEIEFRGAAEPGEAVVRRHGDWLWITSPDDEVHASVARLP